MCLCRIEGEPQPRLETRSGLEAEDAPRQRQAGNAVPHLARTCGKMRDLQLSPRTTGHRFDQFVQTSLSATRNIDDSASRLRNLCGEVTGSCDVAHVDEVPSLLAISIHL